MLPGHLLSKILKNKLQKFTFFYPGNINQQTGGYIYENNIFKINGKNKSFEKLTFILELREKKFALE